MLWIGAIRSIAKPANGDVLENRFYRNWKHLSVTTKNIFSGEIKLFRARTLLCLFTNIFQEESEPEKSFSIRLVCFYVISIQCDIYSEA